MAQEIDIDSKWWFSHTGPLKFCIPDLTGIKFQQSVKFHNEPRTLDLTATVKAGEVWLSQYFAHSAKTASSFKKKKQTNKQKNRYVV